MIRTRALFLAVSLGLFPALYPAGSGWAYDARHLERLMENGHCEQCDLDHADLEGACPA